jgi:iron complex transport system substrate-binding protein
VRSPLAGAVIVALGALSAALAAGCAQPSGASAAAAGTHQVVDSTGASISVPCTVTRIADAWPAHNEVVQMVGAGDKIVAPC